MNNYYVLVDYTSNQIIDHLRILPENWNNICGLSNYDDKKLSDLSWAGHPGLGWIKATSKKIFDFSYNPDWLQFSKNNLKSILSEERSIVQTNVLIYNGNQIKADEKTKMALAAKKIVLEEQGDRTVYWKFSNKFDIISTEDIKNLLNFLESYTQQCFNEEARLHLLIDNAKDLKQLVSLNLTPNWPDNTFNIKL